MSKLSVTSFLITYANFIQRHILVDIVEIVAKQGIVKDITIHEGMPDDHVMEVVAMEFSAIGFTVHVGYLFDVTCRPPRFIFVYYYAIQTL